MTVFKAGRLSELCQINLPVLFFVICNKSQHQLNDLTVGRAALVAADIAKFGQNVTIHSQTKVLKESLYMSVAAVGLHTSTTSFCSGIG